MMVSDAAKKLSELTNRQVEILRLYCDGWDYQSIADKFVLAAGTVRVHMGNIYVKLDLDYFPIEKRRKLLYEVYCPILKNSDVKSSPADSSPP